MQIGSQYNITEEVLRAASARKHLDGLATGGNMDYIWRDLAGANRPAGIPCLVLACVDDAGSPDALDEDALVILYLSEDWTEYISFGPFEDVSCALDWMDVFDGVDIELEATSKAQEALGVATDAVALLKNTMATRPDYKCRGLREYDASWKIIQRFDKYLAPQPEKNHDPIDVLKQLVERHDENHLTSADWDTARSVVTKARQAGCP